MSSNKYLFYDLQLLETELNKRGLHIKNDNLFGKDKISILVVPILQQFCHGLLFTVYCN